MLARLLHAAPLRSPTSVTPASVAPAAPSFKPATSERPAAPWQCLTPAAPAPDQQVCAEASCRTHLTDALRVQRVLPPPMHASTPTAPLNATESALGHAVRCRACVPCPTRTHPQNYSAPAETNRARLNESSSKRWGGGSRRRTAISPSRHRCGRRPLVGRRLGGRVLSRCTERTPEAKRFLPCTRASPRSTAYCERMTPRKETRPKPRDGLRNQAPELAAFRCRPGATRAGTLRR